MSTEVIEYEAGDMRAVGLLALPEGTDQRPGVLVCHEGPGLGNHVKNVAARIADELGFVAFALDYIGGGQVLAGIKLNKNVFGEIRYVLGTDIGSNDVDGIRATVGMTF